MYATTPTHVSRGALIPESTDDLYVSYSACNTSYMRAHSHVMCIIPRGTVTELYFVHFSVTHFQIHDYVKPQNKGVSFGRNNYIIHAQLS